MTTGCGGECCGITHKFRVNWAERPKFRRRVEFARYVLSWIADELPDKFTHHDIYLLIHESWRQPERAHLPLWEQIKLCPTCPWDHRVADWLHTNGYIAVVRRHPGGVPSPFVITELGREFIAQEIT